MNQTLNEPGCTPAQRRHNRIIGAARSTPPSRGAGRQGSAASRCWAGKLQADQQAGPSNWLGLARHLQGVSIEARHYMGPTTASSTEAGGILTPLTGLLSPASRVREQAVGRAQSGQGLG